jgi:F-type H+-transporting ATPase subunit delta
MVTKAEKKTLLVSALGGKSSTEMGRFLDLVLQKGREDLLTEILRDFTVIHERANGIRRARLTVVSAPPEKLLESLRKLVRDTTGDDARIEVTIDTSLIGGFVFDIDDYLLDASVKRQLDIIKEQFIEKNRRII